MSGFLIIGLKHAARLGLIALIVTSLGQIPYKGENLENRYHGWVNSDDFQVAFWKFARPVTWTGEKIEELISSSLKSNGQSLSGR